ncbi:DUF3106 domain-containing protein [Roseateles sp. YR242]|uniref:DUF3106 domain-containing protein n=1 Tax=Roseateles sp. YR242 TaxID=1855305 RepID=UPI0015A67B14|nr:DUF3106 domain-containing protein [Roseateles sp. YR242]
MTLTLASLVDVAMAQVQAPATGASAAAISGTTGTSGTSSALGAPGVSIAPGTSTSATSAPFAASSAPRAAASAVPTTSSLLSPSWASLSPSQKDCLSPLASEWDQLDSALKGKWLEIAARYSKLAPEHQQRVRERMVAWTRMTPAERQKARIGYQYAGDLRSEEQASRLQAKWAAYQALSPEAKQRLAERAAEKSSEPRGVVTKSGAEGLSSRRTVATAAAPAVQRGPLTLTSNGPTVVLARPGATTVLLTQRAEVPLPGASSAGGAVRPLRSPRAGHLNPQTLLPQADAASEPTGASR